MTIKATDPTAIKRIYPHVGEVEDWRAAQTIRLLWDRIHDLTERLQASEATITELVAGHNTNETAVTTASLNARQALTMSQAALAGSIDGGGGAGSGGGGTGGGGGSLPGGGDGGDGSTGCAAAGASGHDTGGLLTAIRAGQIVCGTGNEFSALKNATATLAQREANAEELVRRMIWHLKQAGFSAGRQKNPSGAISKDKLAVVVDAVTRAYDVFSSYDTYTSALHTQMGEVGPANLVDDAGIPD